MTFSSSPAICATSAGPFSVVAVVSRVLEREGRGLKPRRSQDRRGALQAVRHLLDLPDIGRRQRRANRLKPLGPIVDEDPDQLREEITITAEPSHRHREIDGPFGRAIHDLHLREILADGDRPGEVSSGRGRKLGGHRSGHQMGDHELLRAGIARHTAHVGGLRVIGREVLTFSSRLAQPQPGYQPVFAISRTRG